MKLSFSEALQEIKNRVDIVSVISRYLPVKKSGSGYVAICPFHQDKTPSLHISQSKGIFKCFACGASGDLFKFVTDYKKISFSEVIHEMAAEMGIEIFSKELAPEASKEQALIFQVNELAKNFYARFLHNSEDGKNVLKYLHSVRNLTEESINSFELGLAPKNKTAFLQWLQEQTELSNESRKPAFLLSSGLFIEDKHNNSIIDRFRGRLMIPIKDSQGRTVAFGARLLEDTSAQQPKYLNSPETSIYQKGHHLFAWNLAQNFSKTQRQILLLEGYFDVIQAHQAGINWSVGCLGTALTKEQAIILYQSNLNRSIVMGFDNDSAGERALKSSLHVFQECKFNQKLDLRVLNLTEVKDIDEMLIKNNPGEVVKSLQIAPKAYEYTIRQIVNNTNPDDAEQRGAALNEIVDLIHDVNDLIEREILTEQASRGLCFQKNTVLELIRRKEEISKRQSVMRQSPLIYASNSQPSTKHTVSRKMQNVHRAQVKKHVDYARLELELISLLFLTDDLDLTQQIQQASLKDATAIAYRDKLLQMNLQDRQALFNTWCNGIIHSESSENKLDGDLTKVLSEELFQFAKMNKGGNLQAFLQTYQTRTSLMPKIFERWEKLPKISLHPNNEEDDDRKMHQRW